MCLFVVVLVKRTSYNKETKTESENERPENERSHKKDKKASTADSAPDPLVSVKVARLSVESSMKTQSIKLTLQKPRKEFY